MPIHANATMINKRSPSPLVGHQLAGKLIRFIMVGGVSTIIHAWLTHVAVVGWGLPPTKATVSGYLLTLPLNFLLQRTFTFRSTQSPRKEIPRYLVVHGISIISAFLVTYTTVDVLGVDYRWGILVTMVAIPIVAFISMNLWVFQRNPGSACLPEHDESRHE